MVTMCLCLAGMVPPPYPRPQQISVKTVLNRPCSYFNQSLQQTSKQLYTDFCHVLSLKRTFSRGIFSEVHGSLELFHVQMNQFIFYVELIKQLNYHCFKPRTEIIFSSSSGFVDKN